MSASSGWRSGDGALWLSTGAVTLTLLLTVTLLVLLARVGFGHFWPEPLQPSPSLGAAPGRARGYSTFAPAEGGLGPEPSTHRKWIRRLQIFAGSPIAFAARALIARPSSWAAASPTLVCSRLQRLTDRAASPLGNGARERPSCRRRLALEPDALRR